jgi:predicted short-subunit dehydrogenase-like oxidoreductase (DUF2520 family)
MAGISIVGHGRVGSALAFALKRAGAEVERVIVRNKPTGSSQGEDGLRFSTWEDIDSIDSEVVVIATGDSDIPIVDRHLSRFHDLSRMTVLHMSGLLTSEVLEHSRSHGASVGSMHPLASFTGSPDAWKCFAGASFCIEGDDSAVEKALRIATLLGGDPFTVDTRLKPLYHAAAVTACGHVVALLSEAVRMLVECGLSESESSARLQPLVNGTIENFFSKGAGASLTGPFARLDAGAVGVDLEALEGLNEAELTQLFALLGKISVGIAMKTGGDSAKAREVMEKLLMAK